MRLSQRISKGEIFLLLCATAALDLLLAKVFPQGLLVDAPLIFCVYVGWHSTPSRGAFSGALFGLLRDAALGLVLGVNGIAKTLLGFSASSLKKWLAPESFAARAVFLAGVAAADNLAVLALLSLLGRPIAEGVQWDMMLEAGLTALAGAAVFGIYDRIKFPARDFRDLRS